MIPTTEKYEDSGISALLKSLGFIIFFIVLLVICGLIRTAFPSLYNMLIYGTLGSFAGFLAVWVFLKPEKKPFSTVGLIWEKQTGFRFILGIIIGTILFTAMLFTLLFFSELTLQFHTNAFDWKVIFVYLPILPLALMEEIGFRSYPMVKMNKAFGIWTSQIIIAIAFGAYHILNGWTVLSSIAGPFVWAFVFGLAAVWSRGIAMPTGIHFALNLLQNLVGIKSNKGAIWILDYPTGTKQILLERTDHLGWILQASVLIIALIATAGFAMKQKQKTCSN